MGMACLKLLSNSFLIFSVVMATLTTYEDHGDCASASPTDRLSVDVVQPEFYNIHLVVKAYYDFFFGTCEILVHVHDQTRTIRLHAYKIKTELHSIYLQKVNTPDKVNPVEYRYCKISQILDLYFPVDISPAHYTLKFNFHASYGTKENKGLSPYLYKKRRENRRWLITNLLEPIAARRVFPCWDEPGVKAIFNITILHSKEYTVLSNMQAVATEDEADNLQHTYFGISRLMAASEVAIIMFDDLICKLETHNVVHSDHEHTMWLRPTKVGILKFAESMILVHRIALHRYFLGSSILPKVNYVVIPNSFAQAIGSVGLIVYREQDVTYNVKHHFPGRKLKIIKLLAYQEARQWFDTPITSSPWSDMWIRDSLATYFSHFFILEPFYGSHLMDLFVVHVLQPTLHNDKALQMKPVVRETYDSDDIETVLYSSLYNYKGSVILRMLEYILTSWIFRQRIEKYVRDSIQLPYETIDFWTIMQDANNVKKNQTRNISEIMNGWLRQRYYPELFVTHGFKVTNIVTFCEKDTKWRIPINICTQSHLAFCDMSNITWIQCPGSKIISWPPVDEFIIVNFLQAGYYRVNYGYKNWHRIVGYLQYQDYTTIPKQNRAQLIDDAYYFVMEQKLSPTTFTSLIEYLKRETDYVPWYPVFNILSYMYHYLEFNQSQYLKDVILASLSDLLKKIEYEERYEDNEMTNSLRLLAARWACKLGHKQCQEVATTKLQAILNNSTVIRPWWKDWVYCMGMKRLHAHTWHRVLMESILTSDATTFKYLAYTDNNLLLIYYMNMLRRSHRLYEVMGHKELAQHYRSVLKRHLYKHDVFDYVLQNFESIADKFFGKDDLINLWGDIILNLNFEQIESIKIFSSNVSKHLSPGKTVIEYLIKTRLHQLNSLLMTFLPF